MILLNHWDFLTESLWTLFWISSCFFNQPSRQWKIGIILLFTKEAHVADVQNASVIRRRWEAGEGRLCMSQEATSMDNISLTCVTCLYFLSPLSHDYKFLEKKGKICFLKLYVIYSTQQPEKQHWILDFTNITNVHISV